MDNNSFSEHRAFLKDSLRLNIDFRLTDQSRGVDPPPIQKPPRPEQAVIPLPSPEVGRHFSGTDLVDAIASRKSHRRYRPVPLALDELGFLLWATQGVRRIINPAVAFRTVPSAGCRHAFETYLCVLSVETLEPAIYRYLPVDHALVQECGHDHLQEGLVRGALNQDFVGQAPVTFIWTVVPYRMEWRYHLAAHRVILMDAGHVCQNLYLAAAAINGGTCAIAAYHQEAMDELLGVDGRDEFTVYMAATGKV